MGTNIFLGNPPANVQQWIKDHYGPKLDEPLCFTAEEAGSTVGMEVVFESAPPPDVFLEYSTDGNTWSPFEVGYTTVTLAKKGDKMYVRATSEGNTGMGSYSTDYGQYSYNRFVMAGKIAASGNVNTLLDQNGNATLISACYFGLFSGCESLTTAPELPATTLAEDCYSSMFERCTSLTTAPAILPATTLAANCYNGMFKGCSSLTTAPELPATTLDNYCYNNMFYWCSNLNTIKLGYMDNFVDNYFGNWVECVASKGTFYYNGDDRTTGPNAIPTGWTVNKWPVNGK